MSRVSQKGTAFARKAISILQTHFPHLDDQDLIATPSGANGEDIQMSSRAKEGLGWSIECKHYAKIAVYGWYEQAKSNAGDREPVVFMKANHKKPLALMDADYAVRLRKAAGASL